MRYESERWLPYSSLEASYGWQVLGAHKTLATVIPTQILMRLHAAVRGLKPLSQAWEAPQMPILRMLTRQGLPSALVDVTEAELRLAVAAEGGFTSWLRARQGCSDSEVLGFLRSCLYLLEMAEQRTALTNVPGLLEGWDCRPLPADYLTMELAVSPDGTHQIQLEHDSQPPPARPAGDLSIGFSLDGE